MNRTSRVEFLATNLHPAIDRTIAIERFRPGGMIRGKLLMAEPAGKGMNIIRNMARLGHRVTALGFLGRCEAESFLGVLDRRRIKPRFIIVDSPTRHHITLIETATGSDTHITSGKMQVRRSEAAELMRRLRSESRPGRWAVFSGSLPGGMGERDYRRALDICCRGGARLCVDTSGPLLRAALEAHPWAMKPNRKELEDLAGRKLRSLGSVVAAARGLLDHCPNFLVSLGAEGAVLVTEEGVWHGLERPAPPVMHTVGCGDALFSGFLSASARGLKPAEALRFAVACGSVCVRSRHAALQSARAPRELLKRISVRTL